LKTTEDEKPLEEDKERRQKILSMVLKEVKGLGEGSDKGIYPASRTKVSCSSGLLAETEGFFNLLYAHLFDLYPSDSTQTREFITGLLQNLSSSSSGNVHVKYRM
jgi:translation initiation factor 3 subunit M